jgi:hypothetical protein
MIWGICPGLSSHDPERRKKMPLLQGWSWHMRKGPTDRRDWKGLRLVTSDGRPTDQDRPAIQANDRQPGDGARLAPNAQANIGSLLRAMYDSALHEPVPDRFLDLLRQMEAKSEQAAAEKPPTED